MALMGTSEKRETCELIKHNDNVIALQYMALACKGFLCVYNI